MSDHVKPTEMNNLNDKLQDNPVAPDPTQSADTGNQGLSTDSTTDVHGTDHPDQDPEGMGEDQMEDDPTPGKGVEIPKDIVTSEERTEILSEGVEKDLQALEEDKKGSDQATQDAWKEYYKFEQILDKVFYGVTDPSPHEKEPTATKKQYTFTYETVPTSHEAKFLFNVPAEGNKALVVGDWQQDRDFNVEGSIDFVNTDKWYPKMRMTMTYHACTKVPGKEDQKPRRHVIHQVTIAFPYDYPWNDNDFAIQIIDKEERDNNVLGMLRVLTGRDKDTVKEHHDNNELLLCKFNIDPTKCELGASFIIRQIPEAEDLKIPKEFEQQVKYLQKMFRSSKEMNIYALVKWQHRKNVTMPSLTQDFNDHVKLAHKAEMKDPALNYFQTKTNIGRFQNRAAPGQAQESASLLPRNERHPMPFRMELHPASKQEYYLPIGIALSQDLERAEINSRKSTEETIELRLITYPEFLNNTFIGYLRPSHTWNYRIEQKSTLIIDFPEEELFGWIARPAPAYFRLPDHNTGDIAIIMRRPYKKIMIDGTQVRELAIGSPAEILHIAKQKGLEEIYEYLLKGPANIVTVQVKEDLNVVKQNLTAFDKLNPFTKTGDKTDLSNWSKDILMGRCLDQTPEIDLLEGITENIKNEFLEGLTTKQQEFLPYLRKVKNGIAILRGAPGNGKTEIMLRFLRASLRLGRRALIIAPSNELADSIVRRVRKICPTEKEAYRIYPFNTEKTYLSQITAQYKLPNRHFSAMEIDEEDKIAILLKQLAAQYEIEEGKKITRDERLREIETSVIYQILLEADLLDLTTRSIPVRPDEETKSDSEDGQEEYQTGIDEDVALPNDGFFETQILAYRQAANTRTSENTSHDKMLRTFHEKAKKLINGKTLEEGIMPTFKALHDYMLANRAQVVVGTLYTLNIESVVKCGFDTIIMDESQSHLAISCFPIWANYPRCRYLFLGDEKQINAAPMEQGEEDSYNAAAKIGQLSILKQEISRGRKYFTLTENLRSDPRLVQFISQKFYRGIMTPVKRIPKSHRLISTLNQYDIKASKPYVFMDVNSTSIKVGHNRSSRNPEEARAAISLASRLLRKNFEPREIQILTGYQAQKSELFDIRTKACSNIKMPNPEALQQVAINTIHESMGTEREVVILCLTRHEELGFMSEEDILLTGMSRAKEGLIIVGPIRNLLNTLERRKKTSTTIFDVLNTAKVTKNIVSYRLPESFKNIRPTTSTEAEDRAAKRARRDEVLKDAQGDVVMIEPEQEPTWAATAEPVQEPAWRITEAEQESAWGTTEAGQESAWDTTEAQSPTQDDNPASQDDNKTQTGALPLPDDGKGW